MSKTLLLLMSAVCAFAQEKAPEGPPVPIEKVPSEKAPPDVDAALRARIKQFYQAHVDAKYRIADQVVAEESKDLFFAAGKAKYDSYEIVRIGYYDNFTKADAVVATKGTWYMRGEKMPVTMPVTSNWKIIDGQWFWYVIPSTEVSTPFGKMHFDVGKPKDNTPVPALPGDPRVLAEQILKAVKADKTEVELSSFEPASARVSIKNGINGPVKLRLELDNGFKGLSGKLDKSDVARGETAVATFQCDPTDRRPKPPVTARITVEPTNQVIPITINFALPPEFDRMSTRDGRPKPPRN